VLAPDTPTHKHTHTRIRLLLLLGIRVPSTRLPLPGFSCATLQLGLNFCCSISCLLVPIVHAAKCIHSVMTLNSCSCRSCGSSGQMEAIESIPKATYGGGISRSCGVSSIPVESCSWKNLVGCVQVTGAAAMVAGGCRWRRR
jgi:hypothetical protein